MPLRLSSFPLLLLFLLSVPAVAQEGHSEEEFSEGLLLRPLPDRKILSHFRFRTVAPASSFPHHRLFPKSISHLIRRFSIRKLELSFTQGRWDYHRWGASDPVSAAGAKPPGVELWTVFDLPADRVDATWKDLTHALSGLFCASVNFLDSPVSHASPAWAFVENPRGNLRYGALPREAVCTENLTPWLKLLPCRDKAGIASLLDRPSIYRGFYHSQRLRLTSTGSGGMVVEQSLTVVLQPRRMRLGSGSQPDWSIGSLFTRGVRGRCVLAKSTGVFVELEEGLVKELEKFGPSGSWEGSAFELSRAPHDRKTEDSVLYVFDLLNYGKKEDFDVGFSWKRPFVWSPSQALLQASRFLMGSGNERGSIAIRFMAVRSRELSKGRDGCLVDAAVLQIVPWYVKVYYHTLKIFVDGKAQDVSEVVDKFQVSPSEDKLSPGVMELMLKLPCGMKSAVLTVDFDKGFLHIDEYPPDANQGFDIPSAVVSFPNLTVNRNIFKGSSMGKDYLMDGLEEKSPVRSYTEILLVPLTTPDFSMPYNVITFTCTVLALYFGSLLNVLRRRVGEEERLLGQAVQKQGLLPQLVSKLTSKLRRGAPESSGSSLPHPQSSLMSKQLIKVILVAVAAVLWYYFQNDQ